MMIKKSQNVIDLESQLQSWVITSAQECYPVLGNNFSTRILPFLGFTEVNGHHQRNSM